MAAKILIKLHFLRIILQNAYSFYMPIFNVLFVCCQYKIFAEVVLIFIVQMIVISVTLQK